MHSGSSVSSRASSGAPVASERASPLPCTATLATCPLTFDLTAAGPCWNRAVKQFVSAVLQTPVEQDVRWRVAEAAALVPHLVEDTLNAVRHIQQVPFLGIPIRTWQPA